jgi:hypothetical protein
MATPKTSPHFHRLRLPQSGVNETHPASGHLIPRRGEGKQRQGRQITLDTPSGGVILNLSVLPIFRHVQRLAQRRSFMMQAFSLFGLELPWWWLILLPVFIALIVVFVVIRKKQG